MSDATDFGMFLTSAGEASAFQYFRASMMVMPQLVAPPGSTGSFVYLHRQRRGS